MVGGEQPARARGGILTAILFGNEAKRFATATDAKAAFEEFVARDGR
jgi:hypothetical protein